MGAIFVASTRGYRGGRERCSLLVYMYAYMYRYKRLPAFSYSRGAVAELSGAGSVLGGGMHDVRRAVVAPMLRLVGRTWSVDQRQVCWRRDSPVCRGGKINSGLREWILYEGFGSLCEGGLPALVIFVSIRVSL